MNKDTAIFLRAHTETVKPTKHKRKNRSSTRAPVREAPEPKWPTYVLVFDTETTIDERQALTIGFYRFCCYDATGTYTCVEEGLFHADELPLSDPEAMLLLKQYCRGHQADAVPGYPTKLHLRSRSEFIERVFWRAVLNSKALVVAFAMPFDLTRIAVECREARMSSRQARRPNDGWSLVLSQDRDPETNLLRHNPFRPRIKIRPKDSKAAFIQLAGVSIQSKKTGKRLKSYVRGRWLDLRTLGWALRNQSYSLESACQAFGVPGKLAHEPTGRVTLEEIDYCRQDVRATAALLNAMRSEFDLHPIKLDPDRAYSPASIAKAYLKKMGIIPPLQKFQLPAEVLGAAMQAYYGGRAECRIRHTHVPVVYTDFLSEYPTVNTLMGLWQFLIAEHLSTEDATEDVRTLLASFAADMAFDQAFWKKLTFYALVQPSSDILPIRTTYNGRTTNIGINPLNSEEPIWYAGPDIVAAVLITGKVPKIVRAFRLVADGQQSDLSSVALRSMVPIDPKTQDFFRVVIEARARIKSDSSLPKNERDAHSYFLKILANSGSYGLFVEVNPEKAVKGERKPVRVFSGERAFGTTSPVVEPLGPWYCPPLAALITAAGRLLLALLERSVADAGGAYLLCDTDSMAIVASETGGLVPCVGGPHRLPNERDAVKALTWNEVRELARKFEMLNPYDRSAVPGSILKIEDLNFHDGSQREIWGYAIAAKRYALFTRTADSIQVENPKAHGLGYLYPPRRGQDSLADAPIWIVEAWDWILRESLGLSPKEISWFELPATMRFTITTPEVLKVLQARQMKLRYRDRVKPYNFIQSPIIDHIGGHPVGTDADHLTLIAPFSSDPSRWYDRQYVNVHDGKPYRLGQPGKRLPSQAQPKTYGDVVAQYRWHPEAKSLAPESMLCGPRTAGLLIRTPVTVEAPFRYIGKETDRRWEQGEEISMLDSKLVEYSPNETKRLVRDPALQHRIRAVSIRKLAKAAGVTENTVKAARRGDRLQRSTVEKMKKGLDLGVPI